MPKVTKPQVKRGVRKSTPATSELIAEPAEVVDVRPLDAAFAAHRTTLLVKTGNVKLIQQIIPAGGTTPTHEAQGEMVIHCLEGRVLLTVMGRSRDLQAGQLLYLHMNEPFSIQAVEHASLLVTIIVAKRGSNVELIGDDLPAPTRPSLHTP